MKQKIETKASAIRLTSVHFAKLRTLMQFYRSRVWLEKAIDREYKRMEAKNDQRI